MLLTTCPNSTRSRRRMPPSRRASRWQNTCPAKRVAGRKTASRKFFSRPSILRPANASQTLGTHQATWVWAYDFAPGCAVAPNNTATTLPTVTVTDSRPGVLSRVWNALTGWHFEGRAARNGVHPTYDQARAQGSGWELLGPKQSIYHDNGVGQPELKYIHPSGREAVFNGDTLQPITDPRYAGTYNYVNPAPAPENWYNVGGWLNFAGRGVGHLVTDVVPYWMGGNVRGNDPPPEPSKPPGT